MSVDVFFMKHIPCFPESSVSSHQDEDVDFLLYEVTYQYVSGPTEVPAPVIVEAVPPLPEVRSPITQVYSCHCDLPEAITTDISSL